MIPFALTSLASAATFALKPFEATSETTDLALTATVVQDNNILSLSYLLTGDLSKVVIPKIGEAAQREDRLWEKTCFEFFIKMGTGRSAAYWEFNLSPNGGWNVFSLPGYRQKLKEERAFLQLPFSTQVSPETLRLEISVDIGVLRQQALVGRGQPLHMGVSAVILLLPHQESFWAIAHPAAQADFHHPDSFVITLTEITPSTS